jgi:hypothetical protein
MPRDKGRTGRSACATEGDRARQDAGATGEKTTAIQRRQRFLHGQNVADLVTCGTGRNACATEKQKSKTPAGGQRYEKRKNEGDG